MTRYKVVVSGFRHSPKKASKTFNSKAAADRSAKNARMGLNKVARSTGMRRSYLKVKVQKVK